MAKMLWQDRKRWKIGLPWTFTKYTLTSQKLTVETGLFTTKEYDVRLYRILNLNVRRSLIQKIFNLGTIHIDSNDKDLRSFDLVNIKDAKEVCEYLGERIEEERIRNKVSAREYMTDYDDEPYED